MGTEIDRLEVQVEAQATDANKQLDRLIGKLNNIANSLTKVNSGGLAGLANSVERFTRAAGGLSNIKTADFSRFTSNIAKLNAINVQQLYGASSAISTVAKAINGLDGVSGSSMQAAEMAKNISKIGGVNVQRAITNLPQLATAMSNFMDVMSGVPDVSRNVIQMTSALAELASQGGKVGTAANTVSGSLNAQANSTDHATKSARKLSVLLLPDEIVYRVLKGDVETALVTKESWTYRNSSNVPERGYGLKKTNGIYECANNGEIGKTIFFDKKDAVRTAESFLKEHDVLRAEEIRPVKTVAYAYIRDCDGRIMKAFYSELDNGMLYIKGFMTFHHIIKDKEKGIKDFMR